MKKTAVVGGGCFWCLEAQFKLIPGVIAVASGYAGGTDPSPSYEKTCSGASDHAEVVQVTYDDSILSYADLLRLFWMIHDPTTLNRQGPDIGTQYRSIVVCSDPIEESIAREIMAEMEREAYGSGRITTVIQMLAGPGDPASFHRAEEYHQDYNARNQNQPYCQAIINPKLARLRQILQSPKA